MKISLKTEKSVRLYFAVNNLPEIRRVKIVETSVGIFMENLKTFSFKRICKKIKKDFGLKHVTFHRKIGFIHVDTYVKKDINRSTRGSIS